MPISRRRCWGSSAFLYLSLALFFPIPAHGAERGFVNTPNGHNTALIVGVSHGLDGIDIDVNNVAAMTDTPNYKFHNTILMDDHARVADIAKELTQGAADAKDDGTFLYYFSGHGGVGTIWPQDALMSVEQIRAAIESGRSGQGPLKRLVLIYDTCHAGSMMDPMRLMRFGGGVFSERELNGLFADAIVNGMRGGTRDGAAYWEKLMVLASSRADETSAASDKGSIYTLAMKKAYWEAIDKNLTVGEFFAKAQEYTVGHHPVARFVPASLTEEKMVPAAH